MSGQARAGRWAVRGLVALLFGVWLAAALFVAPAGAQTVPPDELYPPTPTTVPAPTTVPPPITVPPAPTTVPPPTTTTTEPPPTTTTTVPPTTTTTAAPATTTTTRPPAPTTTVAPPSPTTLDAVNPDGGRSGPPGVGLDVTGTGYSGCSSVYLFFDGVRIGTTEPDGQGAIRVGGLSVPGDTDQGSYQVTSACRSSGQPVRASSAFDVTEADMHRSAFVTSLTGPGEVELSVQRLGASALAALLIIVLFAFPCKVFNATVEENYDEIRGWFRMPARAVEAASHVSRTLTFVVCSLLAALILAFLSPDFGLDLHGLVLVAGLGVAFIIMSLGFSLPAAFLIHRQTGEWGKLNFLPGSLLVALVLVVLSRLLDFQPGYFYGALAGLAFASALTKEAVGRITSANWAFALLLSAGAWFLNVPVSEAAARSDPSVWAVGLEACLVLVVLWGIESVAVAMLPMRFLDGPKVIEWSRAVWALLLFTGVFAAVLILLAPNSGYVGHTTGEVSIGVLVLFLVFGAISFGLWAYFRYRPRRPVVAAVP